MKLTYPKENFVSRLSTAGKWLILFVSVCCAAEITTAQDSPKTHTSPNPSNSGYESENLSQFDLEDVQKNILDENSLVLEFFLADAQSYLRLIGKSEIDLYILPPRQQIESRIDRLRELLLARELRKNESIEDYQNRIAEAEKTYWLDAQILSDCLLGPIAGKITGKRLIIVPDGKLRSFPIAALPLPNLNHREPLLLYNETTYEPSVAFLNQRSKDKSQSSTAVKDLLIFTDPVFTGDDTRFSIANKPVENFNAETASTDKFRFTVSLDSLPRLTASKTEGDSITNIVGAAATDAFSGFPANRRQLLDAKTEDYKIIHFATHSYTDKSRPELSGIVLSRFDEKGQRLDEFFRPQDIYGLRLNADLVVLSACETGLGKEVEGKGWVSLNNAFLQSGAKSVMASLWKVEDTATLELMKNFYGAMANEHLTPSESLRRAQIELRQNPQYRSPFYWAAFTVEGDYKIVPQLSKSSDRRIYTLLIFPFALIGLIIYRRRFNSFDRKIIDKNLVLSRLFR